ncbi:MAG TPA: delta-60 repeat domain-containing protein, partial [Flavobacteriales bacterium]|nr:delta-60 repeat domain-containing protein [Flavobacteriales bacterium]
MSGEDPAQMEMRKRVQLVAATALVATAMHAQVQFALDTTFKTAIHDQYVNSLAVLPSGEVLLSGSMHFPGDLSTRLLAKVDANGVRVPSFPFGYGGGKLTPWNDRFFVAVGQSIARVFPTGLADNSFIQPDAGPYFSSLQGGAYHVYPDGRVLMSGKHTLNDVERGFVGNYNLIWFSNQGYLDTTRIHRKGNGTLWNFKELPTGGFIFHCGCSTFNDVPVDLIFRTDSAGVPDTTFHSGVFWGSAAHYLPLPDGRVYVAGRFRRSQAPNDTLLLARFMPDGS